jgi:hypothetical protein
MVLSPGRAGGCLAGSRLSTLDSPEIQPAKLRVGSLFSQRETAAVVVPLEFETTTLGRPPIIVRSGDDLEDGPPAVYGREAPPAGEPVPPIAEPHCHRAVAGKIQYDA